MAQVTFNCLKLCAIFIQNEVKFIVTLAILPADISLVTSANPPLKGLLKVFVINSDFTKLQARIYEARRSHLRVSWLLTNFLSVEN